MYVENCRLSHYGVTDDHGEFNRWEEGDALQLSCLYRRGPVSDSAGDVMVAQLSQRHHWCLIVFDFGLHDNSSCLVLMCLCNSDLLAFDIGPNKGLRFTILVCAWVSERTVTKLKNLCQKKLLFHRLIGIFLEGGRSCYLRATTLQIDFIFMFGNNLFFQKHYI